MKTNDFLKHHMERIEQRAEQLRNQPLPTPIVEPKSAPTKLDYEKLLHGWWNSMPPSIRQHPWQIDTIMAAAFKDQPRRPAMRCVATVLRSVGFVKKRDWTRAGRNRRTWHPPTNK
jgi:hypothetical protein